MQIKTFFGRLPTSNIFFQSIDLLEITNQSGYFKPLLIQYKSNNDENKVMLALSSGGILTKRTIFYDLPCDLSQLDQHRLSFLFERIIEICKNNAFIEFRGEIKEKNIVNILNSLGFKKKKWCNILINTTNLDEVYSRISDEKLKQISKSLNNGAKIKVAKNIEEVYQFYIILKQLYRIKVKKPLPDWSFFKAFYEICNQSGNGVFILVEFENRIIGGMMCPIDHNEQLYEWYIAGLDKKMQVRGIYPSVLVTWAALEYANKHNLRQFNFMGAGELGKPYGVRDFKLRFGGELVITARYIKINRPLIYKLGKAAIYILRFL